MLPIPSFSIDDSCIPSLELIDTRTNSIVYFSDANHLKEFKKKDNCAIIVNINAFIAGDILLRVYHQVRLINNNCFNL